MAVSIICISQADLSRHEQEITQLAQRLYGSEPVVRFLEAHVPLQGRVPGVGQQRVNNFRHFLLLRPRCLVLVNVDGACVGFIMFLNVPFPDSVGFGIHPGYAHKGVMSTAWRMVLETCPCFKFPLYGYTSVHNEASNAFLVANGFIRLPGEIDYFGEPSHKYVHHGGNAPDSSPPLPSKQFSSSHPVDHPDTNRMKQPDTRQRSSSYKNHGETKDDDYQDPAMQVGNPNAGGKESLGRPWVGDFMPRPSDLVVPFDLTPDQMSASVYYGAAGIDIQPLLRFGDMASDFIYVNAGLECNEFIRGVGHALRSLEADHPGMLRCIERHPVGRLPGPLLVGYPAFMNEGQRSSYQETFGPYRRDAGTCCWMFRFELRVGTSIRELRLWHFNGEAIATYDIMFIRRKLAPKIFISIQQGLLERPDYLTNAMFASCSVRPKVWVRGIWSTTEFPCFDREVFDAVGIYNQKIWETSGWNADFGYHIEGTTDPRHHPYRCVAGYGEMEVWDQIAPSGDITELYGDHVTIRKRNIRHTPTLHFGYTSKTNNDIQAILAIPPNPPCVRYYSADALKQCEYERVAHLSPPVYTTFRYAWCHYQSQEMYYEEFVNRFTSLHGVHLECDIFYMWPLEYQRNF